jgi:hypothetical protein
MKKSFGTAVNFHGDLSEVDCPLWRDVMKLTKRLQYSLALTEWNYDIGFQA